MTTPNARRVATFVGAEFKSRYDTGSTCPGAPAMNRRATITESLRDELAPNQICLTALAVVGRDILHCRWFNRSQFDIAWGDTVEAAVC
jgi:hypothetical protein